MDKDIYIILSNTGTLFSKTIKLYTKAPYNHTSIGFDSELKELYSFGRKKPNNPLFAGFVKENLRHEFFKNTTCCIYKLTISHNEYLSIRNLIDEFKIETDKYRYNLVGLLGVMFNYPIKRNYHYFCSEFVATLLQESGSYYFEKDLGLVRPSDFHYLKNATLVYEGTFSDYVSGLYKVS